MILAVDTSSQAASCAVLQDGVLLGENFLNVKRTHSHTTLPMIQSLLDSVGISASDIDLWAVSTGPGSFTGLRIGIAAVKGLSMATGKPCAAVSTLEALAQNLTAFSGIIVPTMDARRSQVYTAAFDCAGGVLTRRTPDDALSLEQLHQRLSQLAPTPILLVGDGALLAKSALADLAHVSVAPACLLHQRAGSVAVAAARLAELGTTCSAHELTPAYLRLPQAERERLARLER